MVLTDFRVRNKKTLRTLPNHDYVGCAWFHHAHRVLFRSQPSLLPVKPVFGPFNLLYSLVGCR